jgi:uncharacterized protein GlcG (DUF336 family)
MKLKLIAGFAILVALHSANGQDLKPFLNFNTAHKIMQGCIAFADSSKLNFAISIYDSQGQLVHFARLNGTSVGVGKIAQWKGLSAALYRVSSEETGKWNITNAPDMATIPGGLPILLKDGTAIGGIGVSGAEANIDVLCAEAGLKAAGLYFPKNKQ